MLSDPSDGSALYPPSPEGYSADSSDSPEDSSDSPEDSSTKADASDADPSVPTESLLGMPSALSRTAATRSRHAPYARAARSIMVMEFASLTRGVERSSVVPTVISAIPSFKTSFRLTQPSIRIFSYVTAK